MFSFLLLLSKLQFLIKNRYKKIFCRFFSSSVFRHQNPRSALDPDSLEMLDPIPYPDPDSMNPDPQLWLHPCTYFGNIYIYLGSTCWELFPFDFEYLEHNQNVGMKRTITNHNTTFPTSGCFRPPHAKDDRESRGRAAHTCPSTGRGAAGELLLAGHCPTRPLHQGPRYVEI